MYAFLLNDVQKIMIFYEMQGSISTFDTEIDYANIEQSK